MKKIGGMPFLSPQAAGVAHYVDVQYGRDLEYLWPASPGNAIWRRGDNQKWFGVMMRVAANKIMCDAGTGMIDILDVRCAPDVIDFIVDKKFIFPGWHMNKRHWITLVLDGRMGDAQVCKFLDDSFLLAGRK